MSRSSPLDAEHRALGAKLVDFGGWQMPLSYAEGTIAEHQACRSAAVAFDVSHLGTVRLAGSAAFGTLQSTLTNDLARIGPGRAQYSHLLDDEASVLDDVIVWWIDDETFDVMPNASNTERVTNAIGGGDVTGERALIAVQGPTARSIVTKLSVEAASVPRFAVSAVTWGAVPLVVAGTGYTGEDGVEISVPADHAGALWRALLAAGVAPAGLGARDTLRLEAGLPLHGHELGPGITPLQAGLGWVVAWEKGEFVGRSALVEERARGVHRRLRGIVTEGRQPARAGALVTVADPSGPRTGTVTSGNWSPVLGHGIALAFMPPDVKTGTAVGIDVRGRNLPGTVVKPPFVRPPSPVI